MTNKTITLSIRDVKTLVELLDRGLAYTDAYYRDYKKMDNVWEKVFNQLKSQGAKSVSNGNIKFK